MEDFDQILKKVLEEKAPAGFTNKVMNKLVIEEKTQKVDSNAPILGKGFVIILLSLVGFVFVTIFNFEGSGESKYSIIKYIDRLFAGFDFQFAHSFKLLSFSIAALCVLLFVDYFFRSRKMVQI